jgi:hypothetical protein
MRKLISRKGAVAALVAALSATALTAGIASGEQASSGNVVISFHGSIAPVTLPRKDLAPVGVQIGAKIKTKDHSAPPRLTKIKLDINSHGLIDNKGLPLCSLGKLTNASAGAAKKACGDAEVGSGNVTSRVALPGQTPFSTNGPLLAFNGKYKGKPAIIAHVATTGKLSTTFLIKFTVNKTKGTYGTSLIADIPPIASGNGYISAFDLSLRRKFTFKGQKKSYVEASCPLPAGVPIAGFQFAQSEYLFEDGTKIDQVLKKDCRAKG